MTCPTRDAVNDRCALTDLDCGDCDECLFLRPEYDYGCDCGTCPACVERCQRYLEEEVEP